MGESTRDTQRAFAAIKAIIDGRDVFTESASILVTTEHAVASLLLMLNGWIPSPTPEGIMADMPAKFTIIWEDGRYFVSVPGFKGGVVYSADLVEQMAAALRDAKHWASTRCPVREEKPDPCPLCGATVDGKDLDGVCKSVEAIFPRALLAQLSAALQAYEAAQ